MFPRDPVLNQAARALFESPESAWSPAKAYMHINSPLIAVPAFRRAVLSALDDSTIVGEATRTDQDYLSFNVANGGGGTSERGTDPRRAPKGERRPIRAMDLIAWQLNGIEGAPEFGLDWTTGDKDATLPAIRSFIESSGAEAHAFPSRLQEMDCGESVSLKPPAK
jgi:hypothetical protein